MSSQATSGCTARPRAARVQLAGFECGVRVGPPIVHAIAPGEMFGLPLATAIEMIDEFAEPGRTLLLDLHRALARLASTHPNSQLLNRTPEPKDCPKTEQKELRHEPR
jgi:hypothetical protein